MRDYCEIAMMPCGVIADLRQQLLAERTQRERAESNLDCIVTLCSAFVGMFGLLVKEKDLGTLMEWVDDAPASFKLYVESTLEDKDLAKAVLCIAERERDRDALQERAERAEADSAALVDGLEEACHNCTIGDGECRKDGKCIVPELLSQPHPGDPIREELERLRCDAGRSERRASKLIEAMGYVFWALESCEEGDFSPSELRAHILGTFISDDEGWPEYEEELLELFKTPERKLAESQAEAKRYRDALIIECDRCKIRRDIAELGPCTQPNTCHVGNALNAGKE